MQKILLAAVLLASRDVANDRDHKRQSLSR